MSGSFRTRVRVEFLQQKIRKKVLNISPNLCQLHWNEDDAERSPVVGQDGQEDGQQEEERSDYASPCAAPSFQTWLSRG